MNESEFDKFADEYHAMHAASISASGEGPEYFAEYKAADLAHEYEHCVGHGRKPLRILDFGAGSGGSMPHLRQHFPDAQLTGLDVSRRSLEIAETRFPQLAQFVHFDGANIPFPDDHFDVVFAACVFHHIDHDEHATLLKELRRVLSPEGMTIVFEHNPYNPLTLHVVDSCPFDENAHLIPAVKMHKHFDTAGFHGCRVRYRIFFPRFLRALRPLERWMTWLPLGAQYYLVALK